MKNRLSHIFLSATLLLPSLAQAEFYLRPRGGVAITLDGDTAYSVGAAAGYQWTDFLATEVSYSRLIGTGDAGDGDLIRGEGILSLPLPIVTPFVSAGVGTSHMSDWDTMILAGAGVSLHALGPLYVEGGFSYAAVLDGSDFFEPYAAIGFGF